MSEDRAELVAQLRKEFGDTMTRKQMLAFTEKTGTNLRFLRQPSMKTAPGVFRLPGAAVAAPVKTEPKVASKDDTRKHVASKKRTRKNPDAPMKMEREVLAAPYLQDEDYDEDVPDEQEAPAPSMQPRLRKKGRKTASDGMRVLSVGKGDFRAHWVCGKWGCKGRDVDTPTDGNHDPRCPECGSIMNVHHFVPASVIRKKTAAA